MARGSLARLTPPTGNGAGQEAPTGRNAHARVLLHTPSGMKMLDGAGTPHGLMARGLGAPASSPGGGL